MREKNSLLKNRWLLAALPLGLMLQGGCSGGGSGEDSSPSSGSTTPAASSDRSTSREKRSARDFLPPTITDEFNPDVPADQREGRIGKRGGRLLVRNPANLQHLNVITLTGQPERVVANHLSDSLVDRDPATLEFFPEMAQWWRETDLIKTKTGEVIEGRILEHSDEQVTFIPGAWQVYVSKTDVAQRYDENGTVTINTGRSFSGKITEHQYVLEIDEAYAPEAEEKKQTFAIADLDTFEVNVGTTSQSRPYVKPTCAFEFYIRPGVTWHDGQPFTAADVKFSMDTINTPTVDAQHLRAYYGDVELAEVTENNSAIKFHYARPYFQARAFLAGINGQTYFIPRHIFQPDRFGGDEKAFGDAFNNHPFKENPVYTGPYKVQGWGRGQSLILVRNEDYWKNKLPDGSIALWNTQQPYLDRIEWVLAQDVGAVLKDLQAGRLDVDFDVEPTTWAQASTQTPEFTSRMVRATRLGHLYTYIGWNLQNPLFQDVQVRRALAMLLPRDEIAANVHLGAATPTTGPFLKGGPGYDSSVEPIPYDPEQARMILTRAGWLDRDGDGVLEKEINGRMVPFRFTYYIHNARDYHQKIADIIKEAVEQARIDMSINKSDWSIFAQTIRDKNFDAVRFAWGTNVEPDPFQIWHSSQAEGGGDNFISYKNDRVDEICIKIRETFDPVERWKLAEEMHRIVAEEQPVAFMFAFNEQYFIHRKLRGVRIYPSQYPHDLTEWWWDEVPPGR